MAKIGKQPWVVTNAINIAYELALIARDVVVVGGAVQLRHFETSGKVVLQTLAGMHLDIAILGAKGADSAFGFSIKREEEGCDSREFSLECRSSYDGMKGKMGQKAQFELLDSSHVGYLASG